MRKRRTFNLKSRITSALRRIWLYSPSRRLAVATAKANGNRCGICSKRFAKLQADHLEPVVPVTGFDDWNGYISRMFEGELVMTCEGCHAEKTKSQADERRKNKKRGLNNNKRRKR